MILVPLILTLSLICSSSADKVITLTATEIGGTYTVNIGLGTPRQSFMLQLSTLSQELWTSSINCGESCEEKSKYDSRLSSTHQSDGTSFTTTTGGMDETVNGIMSRDTLILESGNDIVSLNGTSFAEANKIPWNFFIGGNVSGSLGIGFK